VQDLRDHIAERHRGPDFMSGRLAQQRLDGLQVIQDTRQLARRLAERVSRADGISVPVTIACRAGLRRDGSAPCLLYGYGAAACCRARCSRWRRGDGGRLWPRSPSWTA